MPAGTRSSKRNGEVGGAGRVFEGRDVEVLFPDAGPAEQEVAALARARRETVARVRSQASRSSPGGVFEAVASDTSQPLAELPSQFSNPKLQEPSWQVPVEQVVDALARVQGTLHPPQLVVVFSGRSQPLAWLPSQLPNPVLQEPIWQLPVEQVGVALARLQVTLQLPQFVSVLTARSQPFAALKSQLRQRGSHTGAQAPSMQDVDPCAFVQARPQSPQLSTVVSAVSHAVASLSSHSPDPAGHAWQVPVRQVPCSCAQGTSQAPQSARVRSDVSQSAKTASQSPSPAGQPGGQVSAVQGPM